MAGVLAYKLLILIIDIDRFSLSSIVNLFYAELKRLVFNVTKYNERNIKGFINSDNLENEMNPSVELSNDIAFRSGSFFISDILFVNKVSV